MTVDTACRVVRSGALETPWSIVACSQGCWSSPSYLAFFTSVEGANADDRSAPTNSESESETWANYDVTVGSSCRPDRDCLIPPGRLAQNCCPPIAPAVAAFTRPRRPAGGRMGAE